MYDTAYSAMIALLEYKPEHEIRKDTHMSSWRVIYGVMIALLLRGKLESVTRDHPVFVVVITVNYLSPNGEGYVFIYFGLSVYLSVSNITDKRVNGFS